MSVIVAAGLDAAFAEPRPALHPVVWTGRYLDAVAHRVPERPPARSVTTGGAAWLVGAVSAVALGWLAERAARRVGGPGGAVLRGVALWPLLSSRMLLTEVAAVETAVRSDLGAGRTALGRIVSRDTTSLGEEEVRGAAVASLAENLSDSVVAPLVWYVAAGLPGAALHRYANTADACWGYRSPRWLHAGRVAARADDLLNLVPARLTAALLARPADRSRLPADARRTSSPNAGWPMAAMALRLEVSLAKRDHYVLNAGGAAPGPDHVDAALGVARRTTLLAMMLAAAADHLIRTTRGGRR
ncbi:CobD/CbiB family cobalamin biosynthesis protein [Nocardioides euryhalodurans]|uniref:Cobalamin biosynthesis protein CobD n=1 Tax=Nocardioides euryhalodurans TaxID=2518370 RepID=A0A4P7GPE7_9ACTN|nr:CobD/CbiB family cobalamin biosynthesis protein [Nocardioides euryhalodurans]QBR93973.1 cobalamin biosynthesis protein [Nocardioides euryhalodurans]